MLSLKYIILLVGCIVLTTVIDSGLSCHAGHQHGDDDDDDDDDECVSVEVEGDEEEIVLVIEEEGEEESECDKKRRRKRDLAAQNTDGKKVVKNYSRLRKYFTDCLAHIEQDLWDWKTIVDFSVLDTIWYQDTEYNVCKEKDDVDCWKEMVNEYLLEDSPRRQSTKLCIEQYAEDIKRNKGNFNSSALVVVAPNPPRKKRNIQYYWQMTEEQLQEEYSKCVQSFTTGNLPYRKDQEIDSLVNFVNKDIKCGRCNYNHVVISNSRRKRETAFSYSFFTYEYQLGRTTVAPPPTTAPDRTDEIRAIIKDRYRVEWPFTLQALTKQNASISKAFEKCNRRFDREFQRPPPRLPWAQWSKWSECKATCEKVGIQFRVRNCDAGVGRCPGKSTESKDCFASDCATWGRWTAYSPCSTTCGLGKQVSYRNCSTPGACFGSGERSKMCGKKVCYSPWTAWSHCTPYCGKRKQYSYKFCTQSSLDIKCSDLGNKTKVARVKSCPNTPCYGAWSPYSECSVSCGKGVMISRRQCVNPDVVGCPSKQLKREVECIRRPCMGYWSGWSSWSGCTRSCGGLGARRRTRECKGRHSCKGRNSETKKCRYISCKAEWANWNSWSPCNLQRRTRNCLNGVPGEGHCIGETDSLRQCPGCDAPSTTPYPINYEESGVKWATWQRWSECSVSCGIGTTQRKRLSATCQSSPNTKCEGMATESRTCNMHKCPEHDTPTATEPCSDIGGEVCSGLKSKGCNESDKLLCRKSCKMCNS